MGIRRITSIVEGLFYNEDDFNEKQNKLFSEIKLDRVTGEKLLNEVIERNNININFSSEHWMLFSSIAANNEVSVSRILEIGTHNAVTTKVLSKLFPDSKIDTIDLADSSEEFINTYERTHDAERKEFLEYRKNNLESCHNVNFREMDSLLLSKYDNELYDLIWVDGSHRTPEVVGDIINSCRLIKEGGHILIDDVVIKCNLNNHYRSQASYDTINWLSRGGLIDRPPIYFYKYTSWPKNTSTARKFVACLKF